MGKGGAGGAAGMGGAAGEGGGAGGAGGEECRAPLEEHCVSCATYEEAFAAAFRGYEVCSGDGPPSMLPAAGTCGELRWIVTWDTLDEYFEYFDAAGTMVGAIFVTDVYALCDGSSSSKHYGLVPDCERATTARACEPQ